MLMGPHDRAVDHGVLVVGLRRQVLEHSLPHAGLRPAAEAPLHLDPTAEPLREIAPRDAGAGGPRRSGRGPAGTRSRPRLWRARTGVMDEPNLRSSGEPKIA